MLCTEDRRWCACTLERTRNVVHGGLFSLKKGFGLKEISAFSDIFHLPWKLCLSGN